MVWRARGNTAKWKFSDNIKNANFFVYCSENGLATDKFFLRLSGEEWNNFDEFIFVKNFAFDKSENNKVLSSRVSLTL